MKTRIAATAAALLTAAVLTTPVAAQQNPAGVNAPKYNIAVVDISFIFKEHAQFRAKMNGLKDRMKGIESQLEGDRQTLISLEQQKKILKPDSPDFIAVDEQSARKKTEVQLKMKKLRAGFLDDEAAVYYETYQQVSQTIARYAKHYNIALVLRFNGDKADPSNRQTIIGEINKPVQYQDAIDITPDILALVNQGQPAVSSRPAAGSGTTPRR